jgi:hypothetical protein
MKAKDVIRIGRRRMRAASTVASIRPRPLRCRSTANSTIRIAFFAANPIVVRRPTLKYTSFACPKVLAAMRAPKMPTGTARMTANGIDQLS